MAWDAAARELLDPFGGLGDLGDRVLRAVGDPVARFREDALRPVRAARLAAVLEMELEAATRAAMGEVADRARRLAVERVRGELERLMAASRPSVGFELLRAAGLLELWLPELTRGYGVLQNRWHAWDVWDHSLHSCDAAPRDKPLVRWAALLHDIGKPDTRSGAGDDAHFYNHERVGAELADRVLERLRFPLADRERIVHLVREHMFDYRPEWSDAALRRWLRRVGPDAVADLFDLRIADNLGNGTRHGFPPAVAGMRKRIEALLAESQALRVSDLAVDGHDVMRVLGVGPGPVVREALEALLEEVLDVPGANTREHLLRRLEARRAGCAPRPPEA
jgi:putative nucleotidyltransferase with HDIG domain